MIAIRIMALIELLAWPAGIVMIIQQGFWPPLLLVVPIGLWRMTIALQALFRRG